MSAHRDMPRLTVPALAAMKGEKRIVSLTAYTAPVARLLDPYADLLLVGDSLGMVVYGEDSTLSVTLDDMIRHGRAVVRASAKALVAIDLPFGSYQSSPAAAFDSAARVLRETGAAAVKLEGGVEMAETVRFLVLRGIPVIGHIGLMPQHLHTMGGFRWQGRDEETKARIEADAHAIAEAGAFAIVLEGIDAVLGAHITAALKVPTIGIGAGAGCDGQILVSDDLFGLSESSPRFVRRYAEIGRDIAAAAENFASDVRRGDFPAKSHTYGDSLKG